MEVTKPAESAFEEFSRLTNLDHGVQRDRQEYLSRLIDSATVKMQMLSQEADAGEESDQTFQSWLADQIFESSTHLTLQFTEAVMSRTWTRIQSFKLEQVKAILRPKGKDPSTRSLLRDQAEAVIAQV